MARFLGNLGETVGEKDRFFGLSNVIIIISKEFIFKWYCSLGIHVIATQFSRHCSFVSHLGTDSCLAPRKIVKYHWNHLQAVMAVAAAAAKTIKHTVDQ